MIQSQYIIVVFYNSRIYYISLQYYGKIKKKTGENKNKLKTIYPRNKEDLKNNKYGGQSYWFL